MESDNQPVSTDCHKESQEKYPTSNVLQKIPLSLTTLLEM